MSYKTGFYVLLTVLVLTVAYGAFATAHAASQQTLRRTSVEGDGESHCPMMEYLEEKYPDEDFDGLHERMHGDGDFDHDEHHKSMHGESGGRMMGMM